MSRFDVKKFVDPAYPARKSVILRYHKSNFLDIDKKTLLSVSQKEGESIFYLETYKGIDIHILDETSNTTTNTFEALIAMVTIAYCKKLKRRTIIFSSGGNLGEALAAYAQNAGMQAFSFNPLANVPLLSNRLFRRNIHLIGVRDAQRTREMMLLARKKMKKKLGYDPLVPTIDWRLRAARFRGLFLLEYMAKRAITFSAIAQTISAGFGPLALFETLRQSGLEKPSDGLPQFFGIQQEANCYMYQRWKRKRLPPSSSLIVPTLFDKNPHKTFGTYPAIARLLKRVNGDLLTINHQEFKQCISKQVLKTLLKNGLKHKTRGGQLVARSGLMALAGVYKAIEHGIIERGPVLVCMTDGARKNSKPAVPEMIIEEKSDVDRVMELFDREYYI